MDIQLMRVTLNRSYQIFLVALSNGEVRSYRGRELVHTIELKESIAALRFGRYSRENNSLAIVTKSGALELKMLQRSANLGTMKCEQGPPKEQDMKIPIPKKTQLYLDQTEREKKQAPEMHRIFQNDLCKLRLQTTRSYVKLITDGQMGISPIGGTSIRLNPQIQGLGPKFKLSVEIQNGGSTIMSNIPITVAHNQDLYRFERSYSALPILLPGLLCKVVFDLECINPEVAPQSIRVIVLNPMSSIPLISAIVNMPPSEAAEC